MKRDWVEHRCYVEALSHTTAYACTCMRIIDRSRFFHSGRLFRVNLYYAKNNDIFVRYALK